MSCHLTDVFLTIEDLYVTEEYDLSGFGYTGDTCWWDLLIVGFGLPMGSVNNTKT